MKKLIAGNWKMNGLSRDALALAGDVAARVAAGPGLLDRADIVVCPPFVHIGAVTHAVAGTGIAVGGQDCAPAEKGAFTGDVAAPMLRDAGCAYVILGHSERRVGHAETDAVIAAKAQAALNAGLNVIVCVGETETQRAAGEQEQVVLSQLKGALPENAPADRIVIAYEPVWAIGTGKTATPADVAAMHNFIHASLHELLADSGNIRILYGGSVKPDNAAELFRVPHVDGALIGGASLDAGQFLSIAESV